MNTIPNHSRIISSNSIKTEKTRFIIDFRFICQTKITTRYGIVSEFDSNLTLDQIQFEALNLDLIQSCLIIPTYVYLLLCKLYIFVPKSEQNAHFHVCAHFFTQKSKAWCSRCTCTTRKICSHFFAQKCTIYITTYIYELIQSKIPTTTWKH